MTNSPDKEYIMNYMCKDMGIKNKSPEEQQRIIRTYVKKIIVYTDHLDIISEVDTNDGAEGSRSTVYSYEHL